MIEKLFRGKRAETKEWVYGIPAKFRNVHVAVRDVIIPEIDGEHVMLECCVVLPDTVGQFTGLTDVNGNRIFEGDIIKVGNPYGCGAMGVVHIGEYSILPGDTPYNFGAWVKWFYEPDNVYGMRRQELLFWVKEHRMAICGNVHDNPELLTVSSAEAHRTRPE